MTKVSLEYPQCQKVPIPENIATKKVKFFLIFKSLPFLNSSLRLGTRKQWAGEEKKGCGKRQKAEYKRHSAS